MERDRTSEGENYGDQDDEISKERTDQGGLTDRAEERSNDSVTEFPRESDGSDNDGGTVGE